MSLVILVFALSVCFFIKHKRWRYFSHTCHLYQINMWKPKDLQASTQLTDVVLSFMYHMSIYDTELCFYHYDAHLRDCFPWLLRRIQTDYLHLDWTAPPPPTKPTRVAHHSMGLVFCGSKLTVLVHTGFQLLHIPPVYESQVMGNHCGIG